MAELKLGPPGCEKDSKSMQLQHVNVKLLVQNPAEASLEPLIPVFHSWIENRAEDDELLIDVADYIHVPAGPGVVLIGHEGNYSFNGQDIEIFINDRLIAPNNAATLEAFDSDFRLFSQKLFRGKEYSITYGTNPRSLFTAFVKATRPFSVAELLEALS